MFRRSAFGLAAGLAGVLVGVLAALCGVALGIGVARWRAGVPSWSTGADFRLESLGESWFVNDLGVGDFDGDGELDLWTTNHSARQWIRLADGGHFGANAISRLGLDHDDDYPGAEAVAEAGEAPAGALWIHGVGTRLVLEYPDTARGERVTGSVAMPWPVRVEGSAPWRSATTSLPGSPEPDEAGGAISNGSRVDFDVGPGERLAIEAIPPPSDGFPLLVELDPSVDLSKVRVGEQKIAAREHRITLHPKDRHGFALADVWGDASADLFVSRGGARGELARVHPEARDEFFEGGRQRFEDVTSATGIEKNACAGRQTGWLDADGDGWLDLYQVCSRGGGGSRRQPNRLYLRVAPDRFREAAGELGIDFGGPGSFAWLPRRDAPPLLVWADRKALELWERRPGRFERVARHERSGGPSSRLALADADGDGDAEVFEASTAGNWWLEGSGAATDAADLGLPTASVDAGWVDVDLDGTPELFTVPQGLYRRVGARYEATDRLALGARTRGLDVRSGWLDAEGDGDLDLVVGRRSAALAPGWLRALDRTLPNPMGSVLREIADFALPSVTWHERTWAVELIRNEGDVGSWLQIDLRGPRGNRPGVGAIVEVGVADRRHHAFSGQSEGSRFSHTHHRLYVGLGRAEQVDRLRVFWPDGHRTELRDVAAGQRLRVDHLQADGPVVAPPGGRGAGGAAGLAGDLTRHIREPAAPRSPRR